MKRVNALLLALLLACSGTAVFAQQAPAAAPAAPAVVATAQQAEPVQDVKKLRGKLLYKRNQISKLEKAALAGSEDLRGKVTTLETQRRDLLAAAQPKLTELYQQEAELRQQIDSLSAKK